MRISKMFGKMLDGDVELLWRNNKIGNNKETIARTVVRKIDQELMYEAARIDPSGDRCPYPLHTLHGAETCGLIGMILERSKTAKSFLRELKKLLRSSF